ncbi:MAG: cell division protein FtsA [bacterium]|nr:cell division protein FtsA [bacterium]
MVEKPDYIVGLDIGTTKVCCVIGNRTDDGIIEILGTGIAPSLGVKRGVVNDINATVASIVEAVTEATQVAGVEVDSCNVGIAGGHIKSVNSKGVIAISRADKEITDKDIERVLEQARAIALPVDREVLHTIPAEYTVDDQSGITDPRGMAGSRLEAEVHIITGAVTAAQNLVKAVRRADLKVNSLVLEPLASAKAVLTDDEMELGVIMVDIGGGTTDMAIFYEGNIRHTAVLAVGGMNVTRDLAIGLRTPRDAAEQIKKEHASAILTGVEGDDMIEVADVGGRNPRMVNRRMMAEIVGPRMEEILALVNREVAEHRGNEILAAGVVFSGGGSKIKNLCELAEQLYDLPARKGYPISVSGLVEAVADPIYATAVGLTMFGTPKGGKFAEGGESDAIIFQRLLKQMKSWIENLI